MYSRPGCTFIYWSVIQRGKIFNDQRAASDGWREKLNKTNVKFNSSAVPRSVDPSVDEAKCVLQPLEYTRDPSSSTRSDHPFVIVYYRFSQSAASRRDSREQ